MFKLRWLCALFVHYWSTFNAAPQGRVCSVRAAQSRPSVALAKVLDRSRLVDRQLVVLSTNITGRCCAIMPSMSAKKRKAMGGKSSTGASVIVPF